MLYRRGCFWLWGAELSKHHPSHSSCTLFANLAVCANLVCPTGYTSAVALVSPTNVVSCFKHNIIGCVDLPSGAIIGIALFSPECVLRTITPWSLPSASCLWSPTSVENTIFWTCRYTNGIPSSIEVLMLRKTWAHISNSMISVWLSLRESWPSHLSLNPSVVVSSLIRNLAKPTP